MGKIEEGIEDTSKGDVDVAYRVWYLQAELKLWNLWLNVAKGF
jgi:hypothetical protein